MKNQITENLSQPGRFEAVKVFPNAPRQPWEERLQRVKAPVLVVMGTKEQDFPDPMAEGQFLAEKTGGRLVLIEGAGHYSQTEIAEKTVPAGLEFLRLV